MFVTCRELDVGVWIVAIELRLGGVASDEGDLLTSWA